MTKSNVIGYFQRPEGYFKGKTRCWLVFDPESGKTMEAHPFGFFRSHVPAAASFEEAVWLVANHPSCKEFYKLPTT